jgi:dihydroneopterin aldolase
MLPGSLQLRGLRCPGLHGAPPTDVVFLADVTIDIDLEPVALSDSYADVVDLAALAACVRETVSAPPRLLLETVTVHAARLVLDRFPSVLKVRLRLAKTEPPGLDAAEEAVDVTLDRF